MVQSAYIRFEIGRVAEQRVSVGTIAAAVGSSEYNFPASSQKNSVLQSKMNEAL